MGDEEICVSPLHRIALSPFSNSSHLVERIGCPGCEFMDGTSRFMHCPYCQTELPDDAAECTRCDWVRESALEEVPAEDWLAAALSVVPGLGHLYKGHLVSGLLLLCVGGPAFLLLVMWLVPQTFGLSLLLPAGFIAVTAFHAFHLPDVRVQPGARVHALQTLDRWGKRLHR